jgi:flagellar basal-body rod protein FlgG
VYRIDEQGNLQQTSNKLDLAISGNGFLQVTLPSGDTAYTRDGTLALSAGGTIVTADGYLVQPGITIPSNTTNVTINADGEVLATIPGQVAQQNVGQLQLAAFPNDAGLEATGGNLFLQTSASGTAQVGIPGTNGLGTVMQGFVETSNVNVVSEMTNLITAQRAYEMNSRVISASDDMLSTITKLH